MKNIWRIETSVPDVPNSMHTPPQPVYMTNPSYSLQGKMEMVAITLGFPSDIVNLISGLSQDVGELNTEIAKKEGFKKLKDGDNLDDLDAKIGSELADILIWVFQIGTKYGIDVESAYLKKLNTLLKRTYK
jgi:NTP pyrophosphatase (non-canonical NTP hydrolase)